MTFVIDWNGTKEQFFELHDRAIAAVLRAVPTARVGGCEVAGGAAGSYLGDFLAHCASGTNYATGETGTPLDFISFHAKGAPLWINSTGSPGGAGYSRDPQIFLRDRSTVTVGVDGIGALTTHCRILG